LEISNARLAIFLTKAGKSILSVSSVENSIASTAKAIPIKIFLKSLRLKRRKWFLLRQISRSRFLMDATRLSGCRVGRSVMNSK